MQSHLRCLEHNKDINVYCQEENCQNKDKNICCSKCAAKFHDHKTTEISVVIEDIKEAQQKYQTILNQVEYQQQVMTDLSSKITKFIKTNLSFLTDLIENFDFKTLTDLQKGIKISNKTRIDQILSKSKIKINKTNQITENLLKQQIEQYSKLIKEQKFIEAQSSLQGILLQLPNCQVFQKEKERLSQQIQIQNEKVKGQSLFQQQKYKDAQNIYQKTFDNNPNDLESCFQLGLCLRKQLQHRESLRYFDHILSHNPTNQYAFYEKNKEINQITRSGIKEHQQELIIFILNDLNGLQNCYKAMKTISHPQRNLIQGQLLMLNGENTQALDIFDDIVKNGENENEALMLKAEVRVQIFQALLKLGQLKNVLAAKAILASLKNKNFDHERLVVIQDLLKLKNPNVVYS